MLDLSEVYEQLDRLELNKIITEECGPVTELKIDHSDGPEVLAKKLNTIAQLLEEKEAAAAKDEKFLEKEADPAVSMPGSEIEEVGESFYRNVAGTYESDFNKTVRRVAAYEFKQPQKFTEENVEIARLLNSEKVDEPYELESGQEFGKTKLLDYLARIAVLQETEEALRPDPFFAYIDKGKVIKLSDLPDERIMAFLIHHLAIEHRRIARPVDIYRGENKELLAKFYRQVEFALALDSPTFCEFWLEAKRRGMIETIDYLPTKLLAPKNDRLRGLSADAVYIDEVSALTV